jgi:hypothetical protein
LKALTAFYAIRDCFSPPWSIENYGSMNVFEKKEKFCFDNTNFVLNLQPLIR